MLSTIRFGLLLAGAASLFAQERFDAVVRADFFAGFSGDRAALDRGMQKCERVLAANPGDAEAMVWHGAGVFFRSGEAARQEDFVKAGELYRAGLDEMAAAQKLAPENVAVLIPRGATLLTASLSVPGDKGKQLLAMGLEIYEQVYQLQRAYFDHLSGHARGELLFGLADGYLRAGEPQRAHEWFVKLAAVDDPENGHLRQARGYLESGNLSGPSTCAGCHVK
jgi:tetratricopeptide (TPR) repeat protein